MKQLKDTIATWGEEKRAWRGKRHGRRICWRQELLVGEDAEVREGAATEDTGSSGKKRFGWGQRRASSLGGVRRRAAHCYRERGREAQAGGARLGAGRRRERLKRERRRVSPYGAGSAPVGQVDEDDANEWRSTSG